MQRLLVNLTDEEHEELRKKAFETGQSMSQILKGNAFSYKTQFTNNEKVVNLSKEFHPVSK